MKQLQFEFGKTPSCFPESATGCLIISVLSRVGHRGRETSGEDPPREPQVAVRFAVASANRRLIVDRHGNKKLRMLRMLRSSCTTCAHVLMCSCVHVLLSRSGCLGSSRNDLSGSPDDGNENKGERLTLDFIFLIPLRVEFLFSRLFSLSSIDFPRPKLQPSEVRRPSRPWDTRNCPVRKSKLGLQISSLHRMDLSSSSHRSVSVSLDLRRFIFHRYRYPFQFICIHLCHLPHLSRLCRLCHSSRLCQFVLPSPQFQFNACYHQFPSSLVLHIYNSDKLPAILFRPCRQQKPRQLWPNRHEPT